MTHSSTVATGKDHNGLDVTESDIGDIYQFHQYGVRHEIFGWDGPYKSGEKLLLTEIRSPVVTEEGAYIPRKWIFLRLKTGTKVFFRGNRMRHLKKVLALSRDGE